MARIRIFIEDDDFSVDLVTGRRGFASEIRAHWEGQWIQFTADVPLIGSITGRFNPTTCTLESGGLKFTGSPGGFDALCWFDVPIWNKRVGLQVLPDNRQLADLLQWLVPVGAALFVFIGIAASLDS